MQNTKLTANKKAKHYPTLVQRDGDVCFYCVQPFHDAIQGLRRTFDHLNNNEEDNRIENLVLAHWDCNQKKKSNTDWQILAFEKLAENVKLGFESLCVREKKVQTNEGEDELTEGELNRIINKVTDSYFSDKLKDEDDFLPFTDSLNSITYLVQKETRGRGSQPAVRRAIDVRCCSIGEFVVLRENSKKVIRKRTK